MSILKGSYYGECPSIHTSRLARFEYGIRGRVPIVLGRQLAVAWLGEKGPSEQRWLLDIGLVFSVVGLNKTRNSLALDGTLSSIMTIKMADLEPCFKWEPPSDVLKASKKDTGQYNRAHRS
ncbi:unnamed protein product [Boreogadus saida]